MDWTKQPTYSPEVLRRSREAWEDYGPEWSDTRLLAARAGMIFPPPGKASDSWSDQSPSQRAIVIRAIRETPRVLRWALTKGGARSWGDVVGMVLGSRDRMGEAADRAEYDWSFVKDRKPGPVDIRETLESIGDSLGVQRG